MRKQLFYSIIGVLLLGLLTIVGTYAFYSLSVRGNNPINTNSANKCILLGIKDAVSEIKRPSDIIILSATSLGFNSPKSRNYQLCRQIIQCLSDKGCNISISVCKGKGDELINFFNSIK